MFVLVRHSENDLQLTSWYSIRCPFILTTLNRTIFFLFYYWSVFRKYWWLILILVLRPKLRYFELFFSFAWISVDRVCHHHQFVLCFSHWNDIFYWSKLIWEIIHMVKGHELSVHGMLNSVSIHWVIFRSCIVWRREIVLHHRLLFIYIVGWQRCFFSFFFLGSSVSHAQILTHRPQV